MKDNSLRKIGLKEGTEKNMFSLPTFFTLSTVVHWNSIPRDIVEFPSLKVFKMHKVNHFR